MTPVTEYLVGTGIALAIFNTALSALFWAHDRTTASAFVGLSRQLEKARDRRRPVREPMPPVLLGLELRRLGAEVQRIDASDLPPRRCGCGLHRGLRLRAPRVLPLPGGGPCPGTETPLTRAQRFRAESSLLEAGFSW